MEASFLTKKKKSHFFATLLMTKKKKITYQIFTCMHLGWMSKVYYQNSRIQNTPAIRNKQLEQVCKEQNKTGQTANSKAEHNYLHFDTFFKKQMPKQTTQKQTPAAYPIYQVYCRESPNYSTIYHSPKIKSYGIFPWPSTWIWSPILSSHSLVLFFMTGNPLK